MRKLDAIVEGAQLELRHEADGLRHYLNGKPVHAVEVLEMQLEDGSWKLGRYEWTFQEQDCPVISFAQGEEIIWLRPGLKFRWPGQTEEGAAMSDSKWNKSRKNAADADSIQLAPIYTEIQAGMTLMTIVDSLYATDPERASMLHDRALLACNLASLQLTQSEALGEDVEELTRRLAELSARLAAFVKAGPNT